MSPWQKKLIGAVILTFQWYLLKSYSLKVITSQQHKSMMLPIVFSNRPSQLEISTSYRSRSWDAKRGFTSPSMHTVLVKRCALVLFSHHCVHLFLLLFTFNIFSTFRYKFDFVSFQIYPLLNNDDWWRLMM